MSRYGRNRKYRIESVTQHTICAMLEKLEAEDHDICHIFPGTGSQIFLIYALNEEEKEDVNEKIIR